MGKLLKRYLAGIFVIAVIALWLILAGGAFAGERGGEGDVITTSHQEVLGTVDQSYLCDEEGALKMARAWTVSREKLIEVATAVGPVHCITAPRALRFQIVSVVLETVDYEGDAVFALEVASHPEQPRRFTIGWSKANIKWAPGHEPASYNGPGDRI